MANRGEQIGRHNQCFKVKSSELYYCLVIKEFLNPKKLSRANGDVYWQPKNCESIYITLIVKEAETNTDNLVNKIYLMN